MPSVDRRTFIRTTGAASLGAMATFAGCQDSGGGGSEYSLHIGSIQALSGPFAGVGKPIRDGIELGVEQVNEGDNDIEMEVTHTDSEAGADTGVERARELVQEEQVDVLAGFGSSSVANAVGGFGSQQSIPVLNIAAQSETLTGENCQKELFTITTNVSQLTKAVGRTVADVSPDGARIAGIIPDYSFGKKTWNYFTEYINNNTNSEIVAHTEPAFGKGDFQNEIQTMLNANPDVVYTTVWAGDLITLIQQGKQYGLFEEVPEFVHGGGSIMDVSKSLDSDMEEIIAASAYYFEYPDTERNKKFVDAWQNKYDGIPTGVGQEGYAGVQALKNAVEKSGGTSTSDIISGLEGLEFEAPEGTKKIRADDHVCIEESVWTGRLGPVEPIDYYGFAEMMPVPGEEVTQEPRCQL